MPVVIGIDACRRCGSFDRYVNKGGNSCGGCARAWQKRYALAHSAKVLAAARASYRRAREQRQVKNRAWKKANPEKVREYARQGLLAHPERNHLWDKRSPELRRARSRVYRAVKKGTLVRPSTCEQCRLPCRPEAAHRDYARPLDVRWLCMSCHRKWDRAEPKSQYSRTQLRVS